MSESLSTIETFGTTAWERYLWRTSSNNRSMTFRVIVEFDGRVDEDQLMQAIDDSANQHPLLNARLDDSGEAIRWQALRSPQRKFRMSNGSMTRFDLRHQVGMAAGVTNLRDNQSRATFDFQHTCVDGQAAARVVADGFRRATKRRDGETNDRSKLTTAGLDDRDRYDDSTGHPPIKVREGARNLWSTIRGRTYRMDSPSKNANASADCDDDLVCIGTLSTDQSKLAHDSIKSAKLVDNDVALAATFRSLFGQPDSFSKTKAGRRDWITVMNTIDLRSVADRKRTACNRTGLAYARRRRKQVSSPDFVSSLCDEMSYIRERGVGAEFLRGLELAGRSDRLLRWIERRRWFDPTASLTCLTNLRPGARFGFKRGDDGWHFGDSRYVGWIAVPPRPVGCALAIALVKSGDCFRVMMRGARGCFTTAGLQSLASNWFDSFLDVAQPERAESDGRAEVGFETWS